MHIDSLFILERICLVLWLVIFLFNVLENQTHTEIVVSNFQISPLIFYIRLPTRHNKVGAKSHWSDFSRRFMGAILQFYYNKNELGIFEHEMYMSSLTLFKKTNQKTWFSHNKKYASWICRRTSKLWKQVHSTYLISICCSNQQHFPQISTKTELHSQNLN